MKNETKKLAKTISLFILMILTGFIISCKKDFIEPEPQNELITLNVTTNGILISELKSFDINSWIYNYNPNQYELVFQGTQNTYTYNKTIAELKAGFNINIVPDTYIITYTSIHINPTQTINIPISTTIDIKIDQTEILNSGGNLVLNASHNDYLVVIDNSNYYYDGPSMTDKAPYFNYNSENRFFYKIYSTKDPSTGNQDYLYSWGYLDLEIPLTIFYKNDAGTEQQITFNPTKGNVYHIVKSAGGNLTLNIEDMNYNMII